MNCYDGKECTEGCLPFEGGCARLHIPDGAPNLHERKGRPGRREDHQDEAKAAAIYDRGGCRSLANHPDTVVRDPINRPEHYVTAAGIESIDVIEAFGLGFHLGNVFKYMARAGRKTPDKIVDLMKARWYLDREIARLGEAKPG